MAHKYRLVRPAVYIEAEIKQLQARIKELQEELENKPYYIKNEKVNENVNNDLTDDEQIQLCLKCKNLRNNLTCRLENCQYKPIG